MDELNENERQALDAAGEAPPCVSDRDGGGPAVLLKSADFDWVRQLLPDEPNALRLADSRTGLEYALVPAERYERFKAFFEEDPLTRSEKSALLRRAGRRAGWDDEAFDVYDGPPRDAS